MSDPVSVIESAYAADGSDESAWLGRVAAAVNKNIPSSSGSALAYSYTVAKDGYINIRAMAELGDIPIAHAFANVEFAPETRIAVAMLHLAPGIASAATLLQAHMNGGSFLDFVQRTTFANGFADLLTVTSSDPTRSGCLIGVFSKVREPPHRAVSAQWSRLTAHISAGLRLRAKLPETRVEIAKLGGEGILEPGGKVAHAAGDAAGKAAREALRDGARAVDRARGPLRRKDPEAAVEVWRGLVAGRWSLVDHFDTDGRRFLVAHRNDPATPDPRALTERERQVVAYADLGQSNKLIAYELGLSASTVGVLLARARAKLGTLSPQAGGKAARTRSPRSPRPSSRK